MLALLTAATERELRAALPEGTSLREVQPEGVSLNAVHPEGEALTEGVSLREALTEGVSLREALTEGPSLKANGGPAAAARKSAVLSAAQQLQEHRLYATHLAGQPWLVCITGVGPVNAALAMGLALARRPDISAVLNVGLAGTFDLTRAPLGSTIVVGEEIWPEYGLADDTGVDAAGLGFPLWKRDMTGDNAGDPSGYQSGLPTVNQSGSQSGCPTGKQSESMTGNNAGYPSGYQSGLPTVNQSGSQSGCPTGNQSESMTGDNAGDIIDRLPLQVNPVLVALPPLPSPLPQGISLTVAGVTNSAARAARLHQRYAALLENMEGFAVALACARHHVPLVELRTISNVTGSRQPADRNFPLAFRAMNLFFTKYFTPRH